MTAMITEEIFHAYSNCKTKAYLKSKGIGDTDGLFNDWKRRAVEIYAQQCRAKLQAGHKDNGCIEGLPFSEALKDKHSRLLIDSIIETPDTYARIHAIERISAPHQRLQDGGYIPIRFSPTEFLTDHDKLLLAFDAHAISAISGKTPVFGKIMHGSKCRSSRVKLPRLIVNARNMVSDILAQQSNGCPPPLVLNRHCAECEYQKRCRNLAMEKNDLSLLAGMSGKELKKQHAKGIFSVTQLSYTFRPRRRPSRFASKPEKYHHALKALAIRNMKIYVAGEPGLALAGTPIYLDVEGLPDREFYYLIGMRFKMGGVDVQRSFWADGPGDEEIIWREFQRALEGIPNPVLIHYGSYETTFLKRMLKRYGGQNGSPVGTDQPAYKSLNVLSTIYGHIYFPTYSNGLKETAQYLGFKWSDINASGARSIAWRSEWEASKDPDTKNKIITYNAEDCQALETVTNTTGQLCQISNPPNAGTPGDANVVCVDSLKRESLYRFGKPSFTSPELEYINKASYWDYQQSRVYARSGKRPKITGRMSHAGHKPSKHINKVMRVAVPTHCPDCNPNASGRPMRRNAVVYDIHFGRNSLKRWVVKHKYDTYVCPKCRPLLEERLSRHSGRNLAVYLIYQIIELRIPRSIVTRSINRLFDFDLKTGTSTKIKRRMAEYYMGTQENIFQKMIAGNLLHVDETKVNLRGKSGFVWVFTNLHEVVYLYTDTREGDMLKTLLHEYKGVLVSDFYAVYDSINCAQQKCLIHLIRDLNDDVLKNPFDDELKQITGEFAMLLKAMVETVDRYGLKKHFLRKHLVSVKRFYKRLSNSKYQSEIAVKYQVRFEKNRDKLFTFLSHDGIPWNNNNAEHAIKAFAALRDVIRGSSTDEGLQEYLVLLSICETCKNRGIDFLDFLRSGEKDLDVFICSKRKRISAT